MLLWQEWSEGVREEDPMYNAYHVAKSLLEPDHQRAVVAVLLPRDRLGVQMLTICHVHCPCAGSCKESPS
jgi:hypothetical protein